MKQKNKNSKSNFSFFFAISVAVHCVSLYLFLFAAFEVVNILPEEKVMIVEIVPISSVSNIQSSKIRKEKAIEDLTKAHKVLNTHEKEKQEKEITPQKEVEKKAEPERIEEQKQPEKPKEETQKEILPKPPKPEHKEKVPQEVKKLDVKRVPIKEEKSTDTKLDEHKPKKIKKNTKEENELESLLKNLEKASDGNNPKGDRIAQRDASAEKNSVGSYNENMPLSISEIQLIKGIVEKNWNVPIGIRNIKDLQIILYIKLNMDGTLNKLELVGKNCNGINSSLCEALELSAFRAVHQAVPIEGLNSKRYEAWKEMKLVLMPSGI